MMECGERGAGHEGATEPQEVQFRAEENIVSQVSPPTIHPAGMSFSYPVTVTITNSVPGAEIYYTTDGTGWSQPGLKYTGPFKIFQTTTVKAKVRFNRVKGFLPLESPVVQQTIRIVR